MKYGRTIAMSPKALSPSEGDPKVLIFTAMQRLMRNAVDTNKQLISLGQAGLNWATLKFTYKAQDPAATMSEAPGNEHLWTSVGWEADAK